ncbi:MAG: DUF177 domain-containing protein [Lachnospiraceae bacterium]|jgi:uncharacterized protein|nr:DUF177 domain-containing protein [Lachnospiraceae bacterium]
MIINLYDIISVAGKQQQVDVNIDGLQGDFGGEMLKIFTKEPFTLTLNHADKDTLIVKGDVSLDVTRICSRCLEEIQCEYNLSISRTVDTAKNVDYTDDPSEADEISYIEDCNLDVDRLVLDELYTVIPMNVICKDDCLGICKVCGTNLNKSSCNCDQTVPDPRMAVFSDIFNQFKEV